MRTSVHKPQTLTKLPSTKRSTIKYQKIIIFPKRSCKKRHTPEFLYYVNLQGWYIVGKGCVKKSLDNFLHTSVAIGNENTRPSRQLIKVKDDSKCRKWSGRMAISPLETVCTYRRGRWSENNYKTSFKWNFYCAYFPLTNAICCANPNRIMVK